MNIRPMALETVQEIEAKTAAPRDFLRTVEQLRPGQAFTADDVSGVTANAETPQTVGTWFKTPEFRKLAEPTDAAVRSRRTGAWVGVWVRRDDEEMEVAA